MTTNKTPAYIAYAVTGEGRNAFWTRIGGAWPHRNGEGLNIELNAMPLGGRIVLMPPKGRQEGEAA